MEFSRQEYWSGLPFPLPGDLPDPGIEPMSPSLQSESLPLSHLGSAYPPLPPMQPHFRFSSIKLRELLSLLAHSKVGAISSGGFHQETLWTRDESHLSNGEEYPKQKGEHRRSVRPEYSETLRLKERGVKRERRSGRRLCLPHPRYLWSAFRMMLSHSKMLKPTYLRLHFQVTTAFKWRLNAK